MSVRRVPLAVIALLVALGAAAQVVAASQGGVLSRSTEDLWYLTFAYVIAWWVEMDRRASSIAAPFEYSAFMFFFWPLLAPYYLFRTRRWRGLAWGIGLIVLVMVPDVVAMAMYWWDQ